MPHSNSVMATFGMIFTIQISATTEAQLCGGSPVVVVGGGNAAGQAAIFLSEYASKVLLLIRGDDLEKSMSYLTIRIEHTPSIEVRRQTQITGMHGDKALTTIELTSSKTGQIEIIECRTVFVFIGAVPHTKWLPETIRMLERNLPNQALATGDETAMNSWAEARLSNAKRVVRMTDRITRAATTRVAVAKFFRNALITAIGQVPSLRQKIAMQLAELSLAQSRYPDALPLS